MDTQVSWSKNSIVNLSKDQIQYSEGTVSLNTSRLTLTLTGNSKAEFKYSISATDNYIKTNKLQFIIVASSSDKTESTRYRNILKVHVQIEYWKMLQEENGAVSWKPGRFDSFVLNPYLISEIDGYIKEYIQPIDNEYIRNITLTYIYEGENIITFTNPQVYYSVDVYDVAGESGGGGGTAEIKEFTSIGFHRNGAVVYYKGEDLPATLIFDDININTWLADLSAKSKFTVTVNDSDVPYGGSGGV